jgi:hypothetical protein
MLSKILCLLNLVYGAASCVSFILYRFDTAGFWGQAANVNLGVQVLVTGILLLSWRTLSTGWKIACGCGVIVNLVTVSLGVLFNCTYAGMP